MTKNQINQYLNKHIPYKLNSLLAWDYLLYLKQQPQISNERRYAYSESQVVEPAFEISIISGRSLLQFLGITYSAKNKNLVEFKSPKPDDVQVWHLISGKPPYPISKLKAKERKALCTLMKIANKASAHLTTKSSRKNELEALPQARQIIYRMVMDYVDNINKNNVWWHTVVQKSDS
jgi:hypothetical protein